MKKIIVAVFVVVVLAGAAWYFLAGKFGDTARQAQENVVVVELGNIASVVTAQGTLEPKEYVDVGAQVSGLVKQLHAEIGDVVKQGDLIAEIDPDIYEAQLRASEADLKVLGAQIAEQEALVNQAEQKFKRNQSLIKERAISTEVLQDSETAYEVAKAKLTSLNAQIERAQSNLEGNQTNLNYTKIYAPMSGTVVSQSVKEGQTINANQTAPVIVQVANLAVMTAKAQVAEADISKLYVGMPVYFTTLGSRERKWEGQVRQILPSPEKINDVVLYNVLVDVGNDDGMLMTSMTTQMFFVLGEANDVPLIPASLLQKRVPERDTKDAQAYAVRVMGERGAAAQERVVLIGLFDRSRAQVVDGLSVGDRVISLAPVSAAAGNGGSASVPRRAGMARL